MDPTSILSEADCDYVFHLLCVAANERGYDVVFDATLYTWGIIDHEDKKIHIKWDLAPAEAILTLAHELCHATILGCSSGDPLSEFYCEMFANLVSHALGFNFNDRCVLMCTCYAEDLGITEETISSFLAEHASYVTAGAAALIVWLLTAITSRRHKSDSREYRLHSCPRWLRSKTLFDEGALDSTSYWGDYPENLLDRCYSKNCSKYPRYGEVSITRSNDIPFQETTGDIGDRPNEPP